MTGDTDPTLMSPWFILQTSLPCSVPLEPDLCRQLENKGAHWSNWSACQYRADQGKASEPLFLVSCWLGRWKAWE